MVAVTRMQTASQPPETVAFVEQIYVKPSDRRHRVGSDLLKAAALCAPDGPEVLTKYHDNSRKRVDRVALVVRRHAPQQMPARELYAHAGLKFKRRRRLRVARTGEDAGIAPVLARDASTRDDVEGYMEQEAEVVRTRLHVRGTRRLGPRSNRKIEAVPPKEFLATHRAFMQRIVGCHSPYNGGDGADARAIVKNAEFVLCAYEWSQLPMALPYRGR
jgi:ribosomal protein S18 acetylase RimI-like enzyme